MSMKQLGVVIDRLSYLRACDLLLDPSEVSMKTFLKGRDKSFTGIVLERQVEAFEGGLWKEGVKEVIKRLLTDLLDLYDPDTMPIRRVRTLVRCLEFAHLVGPEHASPVWTSEDVNTEIDELLEREVSIM